MEMIWLRELEITITTRERMDPEEASQNFQIWSKQPRPKTTGRTLHNYNGTSTI